MKFLGLEIMKSSQIRDINKKVLELENKIAGTRPSLDLLEQMGTEGIKQLMYPVTRGALYEVADYSDILRNIRIALKTEIFRNGWKFEEAYTVKCANEECGHEYDFEPKKCENCNGTEFLHPDRDQIIDVEKEFKEQVNLNGQNLLDVLEQLEDDFNICLVAGTKIMTRKGKNNFFYKNIEDIKVGDKVWTHTAKLKKVTKIFKREVDEDIVVLHLGNDEIIKVTGNHPIYTTEGWIRAENLTTNNMLFKLAEVHPTWIEKLKNKPVSIVDYSKRRTNTKKRFETINKRKKLGVEYHGSKGHKSPRKGLTYEEFYGIEEGKKIIEKMKQTIKMNDSHKGLGFNFRNKTGNFKLDNNPNWQGGISFEPYGLEFNEDLKTRIRQRDKFVCQVQSCNKNGFIVHHIDYDKKNNDPSNLITLCPEHHTKTNFNRDYWSNNLRVCNGTKILKVSREHYKGTVYNFEVENDHSYVGRGIIFHNCDDAYMILVKQYTYNGKGEIIAGKINEIIRGNPKFMRLVTNKQGQPAFNDKNQKVYICPEHRDKMLIEKNTCGVCGKRAYRCYYAATGMMGDREKIFYMKDEVIHTHKFSSTHLYGFPPILTVWNKVWALLYMDRYFKTAFQKQRPPKGILLVATKSAESLKKTWQELIEEVKENPHMIYPLAVQSDKQGNFAQWIDLMRPMTEMQYVEARNEFRRSIGAVYGVMPLFAADVTVSGGLNQEGLQITVTNRAIAKAQGIYNDKIFPQLIKQFGITDYKLILEPSEEVDEMAEKQRFYQDIMNAQAMKSLGFKVTYNEEGEFEFEEPEEGLTPQEQFGTLPERPTIPHLGATGAAPKRPAMTSPQRFQAEPESVSMSVDVEKLLEQQKEYSMKIDLLTKQIEKLSEMKELSETKRKLRLEKLKEQIDEITESLTKLKRKTKKTKKIKEDKVIPIERFVGKSPRDVEKDERTEMIKRIIYRRSFENLSKAVSDKIKKYLIRAAEKRLLISNMIKNLQRISRNKLSEEEAERIVKTEHQAIKNQLRAFSYGKRDPEAEFKYKWLSIPDNRRTDICKNISRRTKNGVSLEKLKEIIKEESIKGGFDGDRDFTPHIGCRSTFTRTKIKVR